MGKTIIFIPFRKGSKGIPNKNIKEINGKPLFKYATQAASKARVLCEDIQDVVLATDYDLSTLELTWEKLVCSYWNRRGYTSTRDSATTESAIDEYLEEAKVDDFDNILLLQVTNPFITFRHIIQAVEGYKDTGTVMSVVPFNRYIWTQDKVLALYEERRRRQDMDNMYLENGAFYLFNKKEYLTSKNRINYPLDFFEMPIESSFEIDEKEDWKIVEKLLKNSLQI